MSQDNIVSLLCNLSVNDNAAFDFDGTLVNCEIRQKEVLRSILKRKEIDFNDFDYDEWWKYKTNGLNTFDSLIKMNIIPEQADYINKNWIDIVEKPEWLDLDKLHDYVIPLFIKLQYLNKSIFIITARKSEDFFLNQIRKLNLDKYITQYFVVNPQNSIEQKAEKLHQLKASFYLGDTEKDFYAAQKAGINFIAISGGQRSEKFLLSRGIKTVIDDISIYKAKKHTDFMINYMIHPTSDVQTENIGEGTAIWQYCVILKDAVIGKNCNVNFNVFIENDVIIGDNVTLKSGVQIWDGLRIGNNVFISPNVTFTNDLIPRSKIFPEKFLVTTINEGASIGANSTVIGGITIGRFAMIGAGSLINKDIPDHTLWYGNPATFKANICKCGQKLNDLLICSSCKMRYKSTDGIISEI